MVCSIYLAMDIVLLVMMWHLFLAALSATHPVAIA